MNTEMRDKLAKYLLPSGVYDITALRSEFPGDRKRVFDTLWGWTWDANGKEIEPEDETTGMSPEWAAAYLHNKAVYERQESDPDSTVAAVIEEVKQMDYFPMKAFLSNYPGDNVRRAFAREAFKIRDNAPDFSEDLWVSARILIALGLGSFEQGSPSIYAHARSFANGK